MMKPLKRIVLEMEYGLNYSAFSDEAEKSMLNPDLNIEDLASMYEEDNRLRIDNFLESRFSQVVSERIEGDLRYDYTFFSQGNNYLISEQKMASMEAAERENLQLELVDMASRGIGFLYSVYRMEGDNLASAPAELKQLFETVNSGDMLGMISSITGIRDLKGASGQFTRYTRGQYLTRHLDDVKEERRVLGYVLNFTRDWHPDWGGLLQFYEKNGTPRDAWEPRFNSLSLFDVRHVHSVTYVAPHAVSPRYALTGWFSN
jgi:SM-20-related protein